MQAVRVVQEQQELSSDALVEAFFNDRIDLMAAYPSIGPAEFRINIDSRLGSATTTPATPAGTNNTSRSLMPPAMAC